MGRRPRVKPVPRFPFSDRAKPMRRTALSGAFSAENVCPFEAETIS
jgi:hypothetical protein